MVDSPHVIAMRAAGQGMDHAPDGCGCCLASEPLKPPTNRTSNAVRTSDRARSKLLGGPCEYAAPAPLNRNGPSLFVAVGGYPAPAGTTDGGEAAGRLDTEALKGTSYTSGISQQKILVTGCRCRSWCCPHCCMSYWARLRALVMPHLHLFRKARLLTLTIDRKKFASGEEAHRYIEDHGLIRRLLRLFGFKKAIKVLSFHPGDPDWPHWHIVVDIADCGRWVDLKRAWRLWRDEWGVGGCDIQLKKKFASAEAAARYAFGYVQHQHATIPAWVKHCTRAPRAFESYGQLRVAIREAKDQTPDLPDDEHASIDDAIEAGEPDATVERGEAVEPEASRQNPRHHATTTVAERLSKCGRKSALIVQTTYADGGVSYRYVKQVDLSPGQVALAAKLGLISFVQTNRREIGSTSVLDVSLELHGRTVDDAVKEFERECWRCINEADFTPAMQWADGVWADFVGDGVAPF